MVSTSSLRASLTGLVLSTSSEIWKVLPQCSQELFLNLHTQNGCPKCSCKEQQQVGVTAHVRETHVVVVMPHTPQL